MRRKMGRWIAVLLAALLAVGALAAPALGETTTSARAEMSVAAVATAAKQSVVGILTTTKAVRSTEKGHSAGTGFVYGDGLIITNAHVVADAAEVKILYADKTVETVSPDRILTDPTADVALVRVKKQGLVSLPFADSDKLSVGMQVIAIGNPMGFRLGNSVTTGILSGVGRAVGSAYPFLQVDAPINPGNSGGPLLNLYGQVIGMNSAKMSDVGVEGLGFAIPANTAREIATLLLRDGKVERATLGVNLDEGWEAYFGVPDAEGVTIGNIIQDGPLGMTALRPGDTLVKLDNVPIGTTDDYYAFLASKRPGDLVTITVRRGGQLLSVKVRLVSEEALRLAAEEESGQEAGGILMDLTAGQVQEAAEFGRSLAYGEADVNADYFASSGGDYAILWTEYLYVARRLDSAYEFGFNPGVGFQQGVAKEIRNQVEVLMELQGDRADFLRGATYTLEQAGGKRVMGTLNGDVTYTASTDGSVVMADLAVRFSTIGLSPTAAMTVTVKRADGRSTTFQFTIKDLR